MNNKRELTSAQTAQCGVLLTRYKLLFQGVESVAMPIEIGIDLVAYSEKAGRVVPVQVRTNLKPTRARVRGRMALAWTIQRDTPAELAALADLSTNRVWLLTMEQFFDLAQQKRPRNAQLSLLTDLAAGSEEDEAGFGQFEQYLLENRASELF